MANPALVACPSIVPTNVPCPVSAADPSRDGNRPHARTGGGPDPDRGIPRLRLLPSRPRCRGRNEARADQERCRGLRHDARVDARHADLRAREIGQAEHLRQRAGRRLRERELEAVEDHAAIAVDALVGSARETRAEPDVEERNVAERRVAEEQQLGRVDQEVSERELGSTLREQQPAAVVLDGAGETRELAARNREQRFGAAGDMSRSITAEPVGLTEMPTLERSPAEVSRTIVWSPTSGSARALPIPSKNTRARPPTHPATRR